MAHATERAAFGGDFHIWWEGRKDAGQIVRFGGHMTKEQARQAFPWSIDRSPVHDQQGREIDGYVALQRNWDQGVEGPNDTLAVVRDTYTEVQPGEVLDLGDAIVDSGEAHWVSALSLLKGKLVTALLQLGEHIRIDGDPSETVPYLVLSNGNDGMRSLRGAVTPVRVVCKNTHDAALKGAKRSFALRHTKNAKDRIGLMRDSLKLSFQYLDTWQSAMNELVRRSMTIDDLRAFTEAVFPIAEGVENTIRTETQRDELLAIIRTSDTLADLNMTAYRAYNGVSEYADHHRTYRAGKAGSVEDARAIATIDGAGQGIKDRALAILAPDLAVKVKTAG